MGNPDPNLHVAALLGLADSRYRLDDEEGALQAWITATQGPETPFTWRAWVALAGARVRQGDLPGATRAYREAERRAPPEEQPAIASRLGWLNKEMGNTGTAGRYFRRARRRSSCRTPRTPSSPITVAFSLFISYGPTAMADQLGNLLALDKHAIQDGEYWRLFTVTLVHGGLLHLGFNMYALYIVGPLVEALYGRVLFLVVLPARGRSAAPSAATWPSRSRRSEPAAPSSACSACCSCRHGSTSRWSEHRRRALTMQIGVLIVINLVIGFGIGGVASIDNAAHIGGLLAGAWLGVLVVAPRGAQTLRSLWQQVPAERGQIPRSSRRR